MRLAIALAESNITSLAGGPFGAVIVKDGQIIAQSGNQVLKLKDPTAHAEISAIRQACENLGSFDLTGCTIYTSCEPCPMCLGAIYWAHIDKVYYGNTRTDAAAAGFDDEHIYKELEKPIPGRVLRMSQLLREEAIRAFTLWGKTDEKRNY